MKTKGEALESKIRDDIGLLAYLNAERNIGRKFTKLELKVLYSLKINIEKMITKDTRCRKD